MSEPILANKLTAFEQAIIDRLDMMIANQRQSDKTAWALAGIDIEHEQYKAKYREIQNRARNSHITKATLDQLGIEVDA